MARKKKRGRIVSKSHFAFRVLIKCTIMTFGAMLAFFGVGTGLGLIAVGVSILGFGFMAIPFTFVAFLIGAIMLGVAYMGKISIQEAVKMEAVVPQTRRNMEQLSAKQSLLRASTANSVPQETILLRAAHEAAETSPEELLRASV